MASFGALYSLVKDKLQDGFVRNLGWLGLSQVIIRVSRLATTVILPRFLTQEEFGLVALIFAASEFVRIFSDFGIHAKVIQVEEDSLEKTSNSAYWLTWVIYILLFFGQSLIAFPIASFYENDKLILPLCALGSMYLLMPLGKIQYALIQRENRFKVVAYAQAIRYGTANILTAIFALMGMGIWSVVLPLVLTAPIEFLIYLFNHPWRPDLKFTTDQWGGILKFGSNILGMQLLRTLRDNVDYLIVGRFLGVEELGFYYFAFNAGLGISLTIINSVTSALYPHLCAARGSLEKLQETFFKSLKSIALIIVPFVIFQSVLAPLYVPIVFGETWVPAVPILILVCFSAIPRPFDSAAFQLLLATDKPRPGLLWNIFFTSIFIGGILIGVQGGAIGVAVSVLLTHFIFVPMFIAWTVKYTFNSKRFNAL